MDENAKKSFIYFCGQKSYSTMKDLNLWHLELPILRELSYAIQSRESFLGWVFAQDENFILNPKEYYYDKFGLKKICSEKTLFRLEFAVEDLISYKETLERRDKGNEKRIKK